MAQPAPLARPRAWARTVGASGAAGRGLGRALPGVAHRGAFCHPCDPRPNLACPKGGLAPWTRMRYCGEMEKSYRKRRSRELDTLDALEAYRLADESGALLRRVVQLLPMPARSVDKLLRILREVETITDWRIPDCLYECASPEAWDEFQKNTAGGKSG